MATILQPIHFTDPDSKNAVKLSNADYLNGDGDNVYLAMGDEYYNKLLRDNAIDPTDPDLADPLSVLNIKKILICFVEFEIFKDLVDDSRAPFDGQEILPDKYKTKRDDAMKCLDNWLKQLDGNAFFDEPKGSDSPVVSTFYRY